MFKIVLDQFYCMPLKKNETLDDRCLAIEEFMASSGWTWVDVVNQPD